MPCSPCQKRRERLQKLANKNSVSYKGNSPSVKIKLHGRLPIFCQKANKTCMVAVFNQCCVVAKENACDVSNCMVGTDKFQQVLNEYDARIESGELTENEL